MTVTRQSRAPKPRAENLTAMAFQFEHLPEPVYTFTEVRWTPDAQALVAALEGSLKPHRKRLPIRDLRLRVQVRDRGVIGTEKDLGTGFGSQTLTFTTSDPEAAEEHTNHAVAEWVDQAVRKLAQADGASAQALRRLALDGAAVRASVREEPVFGWDVNRHTGTAKEPQGRRLFATLADYVAGLLAGQVVYPDASPLRRVVRKDVTENEVNLMTDVVTLPSGDGEVRFSLGLTVSVETYPGRRLPVVKVHHKKFVWAREPKSGKQKLSGFVLPEGEARALRFEVQKDLALEEDYAVLATEYSLPLDVKTPHLAAHGTRGSYGEHAVVISHKNGRAETDAVLYGVPDLDRRLSFERLEALLAPAGFTRWTGLEEVPSPSKSQTDADMGWKILFEGEGEDEEAVTPRKRAEAERAFQAWAARVKGNIEEHYGGTHHLVIAFAEGLTKDAEKAQDILETVLGEGATIELKMLPRGVHGARSTLRGADLPKPSERAAERVKAWTPFIEELKAYGAEHPDNPVRGVLVLADKHYPTGRDDVINKRVGRIALSKSLGLTVQYLLPIRRKKTGDLARNADNNFRIRVINAWRDLAWKSLGKMDGIERKAREILGTEGRPVLGVGIIRVNRKSGVGNDASFIPYAIELDPVTGTCVGAVMLGQGEGEPSPTPFMPLPDLIRVLTDYGPSYLARRKLTRETNKARGLYTQRFLQQVLVERTRLNPELIVLADASTLSGMWPWLADSKITPGNVTLNDQTHAEQDYPEASVIRIRPDISPKVIMDTPQVRVIVDGEVRRSARRSDADLYRVTDTEPGMETYLSFGSRIAKRPNGVSCYRPIANEDGVMRDPYLDAWQTPNAVDITVVRPGTLEPEALAKFVEALRSEYAHFGSWINAPGPLHFASLLKAYVPDYDLSDEDEEEEEESNMPLLPW
ncbi:hypothetical protein L1280_000536 [Deinococcus sp. HSC-46F16]|uniref:RNaseH domain-containing protein n=1 Tax=Deinococcus sp. HSC-46F16 TaxID=2910968 RepID=UPI00209EAC82|nr:RNaseH domain-containing protein [Deinococcus sp. HSC-46F16]MCP2013408.1 hypothetical protein [Deinococcus sp. HSC-46F16]